MKLLFLDFDGVLHPTSATAGQWLVGAGGLAEAMANFECSIVISSSWRHHHPLQRLIKMLPTRLAERVVGTTGAAYIGQQARHMEILAYLEQASDRLPQWRALDDSRFEFPTDCPELIACNPNTGFSLRQATVLRNWLTDKQSL